MLLGLEIPGFGDIYQVRVCVHDFSEPAECGGNGRGGGGSGSNGSVGVSGVGAGFCGGGDG